MRRRGSITTRLIVLLTLFATLIIGVGMLVDYRLSRDQITTQLRRESGEAVRAVVVDLENWLDGVQGATLLLARILQQRDYSHAGLQQMLKDFVEVNHDIFGAAIALAPGQAATTLGFAPYYFRRGDGLVYADLAGPEHNYQQEAWYRDTVAAGEPMWVEPYFDEAGGRTLMTTFAVPVYRDNGAGQRALYAVVTADVALADLHRYLQRLRLGSSGFGLLLSRSGIILSDRDPANIMRHYSDTAAGATDLARWQAIFDAALAGEVSTGRLGCPDGPGQCVIRLGALESTGWPVGVVYSEHELTAPLRDFQLKAGLIGLLTLLLMAAAVIAVTRRLTRPLTSLARASDRIARGDLDAPLPEPQGNDELAQLVHSFAGMQQDLKAHIAELEVATARRSRLEGELDAARNIQMAMLPGGGEADEREPGFSLWARVSPARAVGGDLYSYYHRGNALFIAVGDVSDKGAPAALFMARTISLLQQLAISATGPADAMAALNDALASGNDNCMFVTVFIGVLDLDSLVLQFCSAGHTAPSLVRAGGASALPQVQGPALGLAPGLAYSVNSVQLRAGDRLAIYTDGIDEAFNERGDMFGTARFNSELSASRTAPPAAAGARVFRAVADFAGDRPQSDDICLLLLDIGDDPPQAVADFTREAGLTGRVQEWLRQALAPLAVPPPILADLLLVLEEIVSNVDKYGELAAGDTVTVALATGPGEIALEVRDRGRAFNPLAEAEQARLGSDIDEAAVGGLGVHLITALTDHQNYRRTGGCNILRVVKLLATARERAPSTPSIAPSAAFNQQQTTGTYRMELTTTVTVEQASGVARVALAGALNTDTAPAFEQRLSKVIEEGHPLTVLDMKGLDYISSAGLRVIFKAAKQAKAAGQRMAAANRKPHIDKVFEILKALPDMAVFANDQELDDYLGAMQERIRGE